MQNCFAVQTNNDEFEVRLQLHRVSYPNGPPERTAAFKALSQDLQRLLELRYLPSLTLFQNIELQKYVHCICGGLSTWPLSPKMAQGLKTLMANKDVEKAANALARLQDYADATTLVGFDPTTLRLTASRSSD